MRSPRGGAWLALVASLLHVSLQGEFQRKLYKELAKNYNPLERPVANDSQPLTVYFSLSLLQIMDVGDVFLLVTNWQLLLDTAPARDLLENHLVPFPRQRSPSYKSSPTPPTSLSEIPSRMRRTKF